MVQGGPGRAAGRPDRRADTQAGGLADGRAGGRAVGGRAAVCSCGHAAPSVAGLCRALVDSFVERVAHGMWAACTQGPAAACPPTARPPARPPARQPARPPACVSALRPGRPAARPGPPCTMAENPCLACYGRLQLDNFDFTLSLGTHAWGPEVAKFVYKTVEFGHLRSNGTRVGFEMRFVCRKLSLPACVPACPHACVPPLLVLACLIA